MDANGTRFHLLLGYDDWAACCDANGQSLRTIWESSPPDDGELGWDRERNELTLKPRLFQFIAARTDQPAQLSQRRGAACDRYGNWYWIDETRRTVQVYSTGSRHVTDFWPSAVVTKRRTSPGGFEPKETSPAPTPSLLSGLAITVDHYLVVGMLEPAGLLIFDLHAGGPPQQLFWPSVVPFEPFDLAPRPGGGVWILDRTQRRYWALDRRFAVIGCDQPETTLAEALEDDFQPREGGEPRRSPRQAFPEGLSFDLASPVMAADPIAIEALPDGTVLILDRTPGSRFAEIYHYRSSELLSRLSTQDMLELIEEGHADHFRLIAYDFALVLAQSGEALGRLYLAVEEGNQAYAFDLYLRAGQLQLEPLPHYFPMRRFGGRGIVASGSQAHYDSGERWLPLVEQRRPRYEIEAILESSLERPWDGREPDCVWHRVMLDACIPPETTVQVWSRAANEQADLAYTRWQAEPCLHLRGDGSEQPYLPRPTGDGQGTWEVLFQRARGRYLQLRLQLVGNGRSTPRLRALRAYYPRFSYLTHYLPAVYREERESASFLDRYLANPEGFFTALEDKIAAAQILFDAHTAPPEALEWLASWFGVALDPAWDEARRRLFIRHALDFFQYRGTLRGLSLALRLAFDACVDETLFSAAPQPSLRAIRLVEKFRLRRAPGVVFGDPTELEGPRLATFAERWQPEHGGEALHRAYQQALKQPATTRFPLADPGSLEWRQFARATLGFVPAISQADVGRWQQFLARRYTRVDALNQAYHWSGPQWVKAFSQVPLPTELPPDGAPLQDWYLFETVVLAARANAHQFSVLLPVSDSLRADSPARRQQLDLAKRIVELEKPAHTTFEVKFFWAMFRLGGVRLGLDTVLDVGSRAPQLTPSAKLGETYLTESYLAPTHPYEVSDRRVLGRDCLSN